MIAASLLHFLSFLLLISSISALNSDGITLLSFRNSLLSRPSTLQNWNYRDATPCSWSGVTCAPQNGSVIGLLLPNSNLLGSIPADVGRLRHLRSLDLSNNSINGTLPTSLFNCSDLQTLSLSSNSISGELSAFISGLKSLRVLNLSDNIFDGRLPESLSSLKNLTNVSLKNNCFSGVVPGGFDSVQVLDLSSNFFNRTLPIDFGGGRLSYLNFSRNKLSGSVSPEFADKIPANAIVDLSYNHLAGELPKTPLFSNQKPEHFAGNVGLCGNPLRKTCMVASLSTPHNLSSDDSATPAIAAIPKNAGKPSNHGGRKFNPEKLVAIIVGDVAAILVLAGLFYYAYRFQRKTKQNPTEIVAVNAKQSKEDHNNKDVQPGSVHESRSLLASFSCINCKTEEDSSETETLSKSDDDHGDSYNHMIVGVKDGEKKECLVMVDGETEIEMETLLKASAYVLGSSGGSIVYKAVIGGGLSFAVRRIGESKVEKMREFEKIVRFIGKFRHRNLVMVRGFYWGGDEKLVIYDYISDRSLAADASYDHVGSSSSHLSFDVRLKIAKGIAKGLSYIHEKKHVHGNIKPSNILLTPDMDPMISDFGLKWLKSGKINYATTQNIDNTTSTSSHGNTMIAYNHRHSINKYTHVALPNSHGCTSSYHAPESMEMARPNPKWDIYSFGIILLELLTGKVFSNKEIDRWNMELSISNNENQVFKIADDEFTAVDVNNENSSTMSCLKLGLRCAAFAPERRPSMKEALQVLEKVQCPSCGSKGNKSDENHRCGHFVSYDIDLV